MKIICYTTAWDKHLDLYHRFVLPSIQPSVDKLRADNIQIEYQLYTSAERQDRRDYSDGLCENLIDCMKKCIHEDSYFFLLMPDTVWGADSLYHIAHYGRGQDAYIALPHLRVDMERFNVTMPMTNQELLKYAWTIPHQTTVNADIDNPNNLCTDRQMLMGVGDLTVCNHYYPTIYFFKPTQFDVTSWESRPKHRGWINADTYFNMYASNTDRVRVIGSSDFAVCVELEDAARHHGPVRPQGRKMPTTIQGRQYGPRFFSTAYCYNIPLRDMRK